MLRTVLVPLDGSWFAESALSSAVGFVMRPGAKLHLVLAHNPSAVPMELGDEVPFGDEGDPEWQARNHLYLATTAAQCSVTHRVTVGYREMDGSAGPAICQEAGRISADLIIMATHGRGGLKRFWLGGVADYVVRHSAVPVMLVHPGGPEAPRVSFPRSILVALDHSKLAEAILDPVIALARITGAAITLAHVCEPDLDARFPGPSGQALPEAQRLAFAMVTSRERLQRAAARLRGMGLPVEIRVVNARSVAAGLLALLAEDRFDLIAMTTHARGGMHRLLMGSVADTVIRGATKPVLLLRPQPAIYERGPVLTLQPPGFEYQDGPGFRTVDTPGAV